MKKPAFFFLALFFYFITSACEIAAEPLKKAKDTIPKERYKITKQEFLERYATDDSTYALIQVYYREKGEAIVCLLISPSALIFSPVTFTYGMIILTCRTRKYLYRSIADYHNGAPIPEEYVNRVKQKIRKEKALYKSRNKA